MHLSRFVCPLFEGLSVGPIASIFWQNEEYASGLGKDISLDGIVCVVDAVYGQQQIAEDHSVDGIGESIR